MKRLLVAVLVLAWSLGISSSALANSGTITVDPTKPGVAGKDIEIVITTSDAGTGQGTSRETTGKYNLTGNDVMNANNKASTIAFLINTMMNHVIATVAKNVVTITDFNILPDPRRSITRIEAKVGTSREKDVIDPENLRAAVAPIDLGITVASGATVGVTGTAFVEIGGPGGFLFMVDTTGLDSMGILTQIENTINDLHSLFLADIVNSELIITGATTDNTYSVFFDDPGIDYGFSVTLVPVPAPLTLLFGGGVALWITRRLRRTAPYAPR